MDDEKNPTAASKFLGYVLRNEPAVVGIALDSGGWVAIDVLLDACAQNSGWVPQYPVPGRPVATAEGPLRRPQ
jgi:RNA:NAD 2'-phosphotransferase (TPT1/KptA family)